MRSPRLYWGELARKKVTVRHFAVVGLLAAIGCTLLLAQMPANSLGRAEAATTPAFVQTGFLRVPSGSTVSAAFPASNTPGNAIVAYVLWSNQASAALSDSLGNAYHAAAGPKVWGSSWSAQVFYSVGIKTGTNTVTATFSSPVASFALLYIHEYSGVDPSSPFDGTSAAAGGSGPLNSGIITTTNANDLLFSAAASDDTVTSAGAGYTVRNTNRGNMTADRNVTTPGQYNASGTQTGNAWVIQVVALRAAASVTSASSTVTPTRTPTSAPTLTVTPTRTPTSAPTLTATPTQGLAPSATGSTPTFVQTNFVRVASGTAVSASFVNANTAGNTIVVYVLWSNPTSASLADSRGDIYQSASAPVRWGNNWSAQVFYATGIQGGANTVTANFSSAVSSFALLYIHEYSGFNPSTPLDGASAAAGPSGPLNSGFITTANANDVLFSAAASDDTVNSAGPGYSIRNVAQGNMTADRNVASTGQYNASGTQTGNAWVIQVVAFRGGASASAPASATATPTVKPTSTATPTRTPVPATSTPTTVPTATSVPVTGSFAYPLKKSTNGRYLVDQNGKPFLMAGDSPQSLIGNLSLSDADSYFADRQTNGFNSAWINLLCDSYTYCNSDGTTFDGIPPFSTSGDLSTPNPTYFSKVDQVLQLAANHGIVVFLDPIETGGWLPVLRNNGTTKAFNYGVFLGNRYKNFPNIVWQHGNDFQSWSTASDDALVLAVANGIRSVDSNHLPTIELNYYVSGSLDDSNWASIIGMDAAYTYYPTYDRVLFEYNRAATPVFMVEASYEFEGNFSDPETPNMLRRQEYWTLLSGATGQHYGNHYTVTFTSGWKSHLDTPGASQFNLVSKLFNARQWYNLVPDQNHTVMTAGYGTYNAGSVSSNDYSTTARTADGTLVIAYVPTMRTVTIDTTKLAAPFTARWFDPVAGTYTTIGTGLPNAGTRQFTPPGNNAEGSGDWVLLLETKPAP